MTNPHVVIAGAGPTGLTLAAELRLAGVEVVIVERRPTQEVAGTRARGFHSRTLEVFDQRGIADRFLREGKAMQVAGFGLVPLDISDLPTRHPYGVAIFQSQTEHILAQWAAELQVPVLRGREVSGLEQDEHGVTVSLSGGEPLRAQYLVGCDGGRSLVRKAAGIDFPGWDASVSNLLAEVRFATTPKWGFHGQHAIGPLPDGRASVLLTEEHVGATSEPTLADVSALLTKVYGTDFGVHSPTWVTRFTDAARQASSYRAGRVLLAGDAAHIHYPAGGQGLNLGVQDAVNLGWKLAQVVKGTSPASLLDTYHSERHPIAARVLRLTMAQVAMRRTDERSKALSETVAELLGTPEGRRRYGALMSGLDIRYDLGAGHPLVGRRMPDLEVVTADGPRRVFSFLHRAQPLLLTLAPAAVTTSVQTVEARYHGPWELPVIGAVPPPAAVLVRPDGYVAWAGEPSDPKLKDALTTWFGC